MPKVIILGSSNAVPSRDHENTHLAIIGEERSILVDCVSNPIVHVADSLHADIIASPSHTRTFQWHRIRDPSGLPVYSTRMLWSDATFPLSQRSP